MYLSGRAILYIDLLQGMTHKIQAPQQEEWNLCCKTTTSPAMNAYDCNKKCAFMQGNKYKKQMIQNLVLQDIAHVGDL